MNMMFRTLVLMILLFPGSAFSGVPGQVNFQGVLLGNANQVVTGSVNFNFALFDAAFGGTQLWSETQPGIAVNAGIYTVALGSVVPLSTEILSGGAVYLEVSVDGEILSPRQRLLAVPYAFKAEEAENVAGVSGIFIQQLFQNVDWDGQNIANDDPLEGVADIDGDGLANFMDPDNDGDGILDDAEISNGTGVNLITPVITTIDNGSSAATAAAGEPTLMTITGQNFLTGFSVQVGVENPVPQNATSTSFDISVGTNQVGGVVAVTVTNPNLETATGSILFYDKLVFVTSGFQENALDQRASVADAFCSQAAANAGLSGSFVAWYSDPDFSISAKDRLPTNGGPWARLDGVVIAADIADLTDGSIAAGISVNEFGAASGVTVVATNTLASGDFDPNSCFGTNTDRGRSGQTNLSNTGWTDVGTGSLCLVYRPYYCFQE